MVSHTRMPACGIIDLSGVLKWGFVRKRFLICEPSLRVVVRALVVVGMVPGIAVSTLRPL